MIIIGGDIVPTKTNIDKFIQGDITDLLGEDLINIVQKADYRIFNLEVPLTDTKDPITKYGPNLIAPVACANGFAKIGIDLFTLANNHIMDQNEEGMFSTIQTLNDVGISYVGAGKNIHEACKPFYITVAGINYGIYACAEHEFSIAEEEKCGANPFDALESPDHIAKMKTTCEYIIVLYHGGKEHYRYPSPDLQKNCRKLIEKGADLVVCQHSHCIGCAEQYLDGTIVYGQGNFLFDAQSNEYWDTGLLIGIDADGNIKYYPIEKNENRVRCATGENAERIIQDFKERSKEITETEHVEERYNEFADDNIDHYLLKLSGINENIIYRILNKLTNHRLEKMISQKYNRRTGVAIRNYIECEAHRELLLRGLKRK